MRLPILFACAILSGCGEPEPAPSVRPDAPFGLNSSASSPATSMVPAPSPRLEEARAAIAKEPAVVDFILDPNNGVALQVAVRDDGTRRYGYAEHLCLLLADYDFDMQRTVVRVVDAAKVASSNGDFRSISLGTVQCWDQGRWD